MESEIYNFDTQKNARLFYRLMRLGMGGAVLHIGAHPDDEDIGLLAYLSCKFGVRSVYWSATRGEGGQNRIGPYREEALGIYRTWESMEARKEDGGESLFGPFYDFGYSKNGEEALTKWGREPLVREIVRAIRMVRPQVIVARWTGTPEDFHGHHQAVGQAALEAFDSAGDADMFSQLKAQGLAAWTPLKYYQSTNNSGGDLSAGGALNVRGLVNPDYEKSGFLRINTGEFDPIAGRTYQERGWLAYNKHQTQAMGLTPVPGDFYYYFRLNKSLVPVPDREASIFDGLDPALTGLADHPGHDSLFLRSRLESIAKLTRKAQQVFRIHDPSEAAEPLFDALELLRGTVADLPEKGGLSREAGHAVNSYLTSRIGDFQEVIATCLGMELECLTDKHRVVSGQRFRVSACLWNHGGTRLDRTDFSISLPSGWTYECLETSVQDTEPVSRPFIDGAVGGKAGFEATVSDTADCSCPYWLCRPKTAYVYNCPQGSPSGLSLGPPEAEVICKVAVGNHEIHLHRPIVCREAFPGGFRELPLVVIAPISLHPKRNSELLTTRNDEQTVELHVAARNNSGGPVDGTLQLVCPPGWAVAPEGMELSFKTPGETRTVVFTVTIPSGASAGSYPLDYRIRSGKRDYATVVTPVRMGAPGMRASADESSCVREEFILTPARVILHVLDVKLVPERQYGYVLGAEEELCEALKSLGISFHMIQDAEIPYLDLTRFDAVVIGPNAYLVRDELRKYASRFLEYVENGGTLVVQYQGYRYQTPGFAPYPFRYSQPHDRVTHEDAPVTILDPEHLLFRLPNPISQADFHEWVRERGLYFFGEWDKRYNALLSCWDPGEAPQKGGLMECQYGKGTFIYTGYSFFRQLPAGVPGAFRLFANLLALPESRIMERTAFLRKIGIFSLLTEDQLEPLARIMSERWMDDGAYLCRQGEVGYEMFVVYRGEVQVVRETDGQEEVIYHAREGDSLGEMAVLGDIPRTASLRARGDVRLLVIKGSHFVSLITQHPDMAIQVIKLLVKRLTPVR